MIESEKLGNAQNGQSGVYENSSPNCIKSTFQNNKNNKYINNNYNSFQNKKNGYKGRTYPDGYLDTLYANNDFMKGKIENG